MHGRLWLFNLEIKMVSKLKKQKIRDIWKTEDRDFTPWLVENIELLNEDLGLNIQDPESEKRLDTFKVDIVAEDNEGKVVIENQFERSDHDHLGKLLTYISNVENTKKAIWIVEEAKSEHQRAIDWLNANVRTCSFYLVKIQVFKIKDSEPGAQFFLISGPDENISAVGKIKEKDSQKEEIKFRFWSAFFEKLKKRSNIFSNTAPKPRTYIGVSAGIRGVNYNVAAGKNSTQVEIYIDRGKEEGKASNTKILKALESNKSDIEKIFGKKLDWELLESSRACRISLRSNIGGFDNEENWDDTHEFLVENLVKLESATKKYIKDIERLFK
jgi:hypothetical protein|tara:strand:+ start:9 stop:992 length:984 start_codon:yes stop_codon:yes gene_type:complete